MRLNLRTGAAAIAVVIGLGMTAAAVAQDAPKIRRVPAQQTTEVKGDVLYQANCASCHGMSGKGDGPAAPALKGPVPDLTQIARRNGGKFPEMQVYSVLSNETTMAAHGSKEMPIWGTIFRQMSPQNESLGKLRYHNIVQHLKEMQAK
jgi:mono/diheme cytochrome c family protein